MHGGGSSKEYFDAAADPALSLLRLGPAVGFTAVAPDRPGYGPDGLLQDTMPADDRTHLLYATLDAALGGRPGGAGTFLVCHSMGCVAGLRMAGEPRGPDLLGIEISGIGLTRQPPADAVFSGRAEGGGRSLLRRLVWGPEELYPEGTREFQRLAPGPTSRTTTSGAGRPSCPSWPAG